MRKEYLQELEDLKSRMEEAEKFAEKLPIFAESDWAIVIGVLFLGSLLKD